MCDGVSSSLYERERTLVNFSRRKGLDVLYISKGRLGGVKIVITLRAAKLGRAHAGSEVTKL